MMETWKSGATLSLYTGQCVCGGVYCDDYYYFITFVPDYLWFEHFTCNSVLFCFNKSSHRTRLNIPTTYTTAQAHILSRLSSQNTKFQSSSSKPEEVGYSLTTNFVSKASQSHRDPTLPTTFDLLSRGYSEE